MFSRIFRTHRLIYRPYHSNVLKHDKIPRATAFLTDASESEDEDAFLTTTAFLATTTALLATTVFFATTIFSLESDEEGRVGCQFGKLLLDLKRFEHREDD